MVVDDQAVFRQAAGALIEATEDFALVGAVSSGRRALEAADSLDPDLVLLDVRMPGMDGFETAARLHATHPEAVVILVTAEQPPHLPGGMSASGAAALVPKQGLGPELLRRLWREHGPSRVAGPAPGHVARQPPPG
jgi:DNA-binding NarL/FixJ family response regulator